MKLSVSLGSVFGRMPYTESIKKCAQLGYEAVEFWGLGDNDPAVIRDCLQENNMNMTSICTREFNLVNDANRQNYLEQMRLSIADAKLINCPALITQVGADDGRARKEQHASIVAGLKAAAPYLEEAGVTMLVEPLNTFVDHKGYYLWSSIEGFEIIDEVGSPNVKIIYDIYHQQIMEGHIISNIKQGFNQIAHFHAAGNPGRNEPWFGEINYEGIFAAIEGMGYKGYCALEYRPLLAPEESLKEAMRRYKSTPAQTYTADKSRLIIDLPK